MSSGRPFALIVGCGYVGRRLVDRLRAQFDIMATVRTPTSLASLERSGISAMLLDLDRVRSNVLLPERLDQEVIYYLVPPPGTGESDLRIDRFLQLATVPPRTFVYLSTTGVYGDADGAWVDESTRVQPMTDRARRRVSAEEMTRVWCNERHVRRIVLRVPGIYGPGRLPLERLRRREPMIDKRDAGISNRIHVDDLVEACVRCVTNPEARGVYNVTDGNACSATEFAEKVASIAGLPPPPQVSMEEAQLTFSPERLSFISESRRVSNERMLKHLGVQLKYADMEAGIRASLSADSEA
jgi:nucleoside-diphosphate-sugar epimerase